MPKPPWRPWTPASRKRTSTASSPTSPTWTITCAMRWRSPSTSDRRQPPRWSRASRSARAPLVACSSITRPSAIRRASAMSSSPSSADNFFSGLPASGAVKALAENRDKEFEAPVRPSLPACFASRGSAPHARVRDNAGTAGRGRGDDATPRASLNPRAHSGNRLPSSTVLRSRPIAVAVHAADVLTGVRRRRRRLSSRPVSGRRSGAAGDRDSRHGHGLRRPRWPSGPQLAESGTPTYLDRHCASASRR